MTAPVKPYALPETLPANLEQVKAYWRSLLRGGAEMPFADDLSLEALPDLSERLALVEVFVLPERFRFAYIGPKLSVEPSTSLGGKFLDEVNPGFPLEFLRSQCSATVESAAPTFYQQAADKDHNASAYSRLIMPLWGDGHISLLLVALDWR